MCNAALQHIVADPAWRVLHARIGDRLLRRLLLSSSIFVLTSQTTYLQLAGCPISLVAKKRSSQVREERDPGRVRKTSGVERRPRWSVQHHARLCRTCPCSCQASSAGPRVRRACAMAARLDSC
jgi:hypothetical protein